MAHHARPADHRPSGAGGRMTRPPAIGPILKKFLTGQNRPLTATQIGDQIGYPASDVRKALNALQFLGEPVRYQPPKKIGGAGFWSFAADAHPRVRLPPQIDPLPKHCQPGITPEDLAWMKKYRDSAKARSQQAERQAQQVNAMRGRV